MSTSATLNYESVGDADDIVQYRALHTGAVIGLVFAVFSAGVTLVVPSGDATEVFWIGLLNIAALVICLWSLRRIRSASEQFTGAPLAVIGITLSTMFLVGGVSHGMYVYATEVRDGYTRISFNAMRPDEIQERNGHVVPPEIAALDGKRVFIKGFMRPDSITVSKGIDRFLLVRDNNQCCFGSLSDVKYFDQLDVTMVDSKTVDYSDGVFRMHGILGVAPQNVLRGAQYPVFTLKAQYAD